MNKKQDELKKSQITTTDNNKKRSKPKVKDSKGTLSLTVGKKSEQNKNKPNDPKKRKGQTGSRSDLPLTDVNKKNKKVNGATNSNDKKSPSVSDRSKQLGKKNDNSSKQSLSVKSNQSSSDKRKVSTEKPLINDSKRTSESLFGKDIKIVFLGGVGEIGKNMTAIEVDGQILIVDLGMTFPDDGAPGVDAIIPDFSYVRENIQNVVGVVITHGHEDHIGALPYFLAEFDVPVYGSAVTLSLLEAKLEERKLKPTLITVKDKDVVRIGAFTVEFFHVCHSISGAFALAIKTSKGVVFHTGDFKIDFTPVDEDHMDLQRFAELGKKGVTLMLGESTNVEREGYTVSERAVGDTFDRIFAENTARRIIIATFASNINRLQQIIDVAAKYSRVVSFAGRSMVKSYEIGKKLDILRCLPDDIVDLERAVKMPDDKVCIVVTGSQGEPMSALTRMASGEYNKVAVGQNDTVIISASPIPGNEKSVYAVINNLYKYGAKVCYHTLRDLHVSGHAHREELKLMMSLIKPKYFMPVHGEYRHQVLHKEMAISLGVKEENVLIPELGNRISVSKNGLKRLPDVAAGNSYIEGDTVGDNMENVLSDRKILSEEGLIIVLLSVERNRRMTEEPDILTRGISFSESFLEQLKEELWSVLEDKKYDPDQRSALKLKISRTIRNRTRKELKTVPMVIPLIVEK